MPTVAEALDIGWKRHQGGDVRGAESIYQQVLDVAPQNANAWCFLGMARHDQSRYEEAEQAYAEALRIQPEFPIALSNLGNTLKQQGKLDEAVASCRKSLQIKPDYATAYNNLGVAMVAQGRLQEAADSFETAIGLMPEDAVAHTNLGAALVRQGRFEEGTEQAQAALKLNPRYAEAHKNQAIVWLLLGDFERGWPEYEWRWQCPGSKLPSFLQSQWEGEPLDEKTILLFAEQGLGDTIQFIRYAASMQQQAKRVVVSVQKPLLKLLKDAPGIDQLIAHGETPPHFDVYVPLLSLPRVVRTRLENIPRSVPYLYPNQQLVESWRQRLAASPGFRVGIAWQGSPDFHADHHRSITLPTFAPLAEIPGVTLFSLQKGFGSEQLDTVDFDVVRFDQIDVQSGAFMDTAAIMSCLDLVITSDTSIPHLAGALGVPTWVALPLAPDWRWLLERSDSPWYPTMELFRQTELSNWSAVFRRIAERLRERVATHPALTTDVPTPPVTEPPAQEEDPRPSAGFNRQKQCRHGTMLYNRNDIYIGRSLELYGEFSEGEIDIFRQFLLPQKTVVEAGANIGTHTVALSRIVGEQGRVWAFESQRIVFQTLCANVALNSLTNVDCRQVALGATTDELFIPPLDYSRENNFGGLGLGSYSRGEPVSQVTLDSFDLPACDLIKIDIEGMERDVLIGAEQTIARHRPVLYVENDRQDKSATLLDWLRSAKFRLFRHEPPLFRPDNYFRNSKNAFGRIVSINLLCIPAEVDVRIDDLAEI
jgi:FkbM family methyltransferase